MGPENWTPKILAVREVTREMSTTTEIEVSVMDLWRPNDFAIFVFFAQDFMCRNTWTFRKYLHEHLSSTHIVENFRPSVGQQSLKILGFSLFCEWISATKRFCNSRLLFKRLYTYKHWDPPKLFTRAIRLIPHRRKFSSISTQTFFNLQLIGSSQKIKPTFSAGVKQLRCVDFKRQTHYVYSCFVLTSVYSLFALGPKEKKLRHCRKQLLSRVWSFWIMILKIKIIVASYFWL